MKDSGAGEQPCRGAGRSRASTFAVHAGAQVGRALRAAAAITCMQHDGVNFDGFIKVHAVRSQLPPASASTSLIN